MNEFFADGMKTEKKRRILYCIVITVLCCLVFGLFFAKGYCITEYAVGGAYNARFVVSEDGVLTADTAPDADLNDSISFNRYCSIDYPDRPLITTAALAAAVYLTWTGLRKRKDTSVSSFTAAGIALGLFLAYSHDCAHIVTSGVTYSIFDEEVYFSHFSFRLSGVFFIETVLLAVIFALMAANVFYRHCLPFLSSQFRRRFTKPEMSTETE